MTAASKLKVQELEGISHELHQALEVLRAAPDDIAVALLRNLRDKGSVQEFLHTNIPGSKETRLFPAHGMPTPTSPLACSTLEFDLNTRYPNAFPPIEPIEVADVDLHLLSVDSFSSPRPRLRKKLKRSRSVYEDQDETPGSSSSPTSPRLHTSLVTTTAEPVKYADSRLNDLQVRSWTSVPASNDFAARALSFYLRNEHPVLAVFDAHLFIRDLIRGQGRFCSPLLVSSVLAWSCATYAAFEVEAERLSTAFLEEAKNRWEEEGHRDDITAVSAAILLALTCNHYGMDRVGLLYLDASAEMGSRLGLFGTRDWQASPPNFEDQETKGAASFAAWGAFGWHTLHSLYFRRMHQIWTPPPLPIPGDRFGPALAHYMGNTFTWISKFWVIVHETFGDDYSNYCCSPLFEAEAAYRKLLVWSENLPEIARRDSSCAHHVLIMHIWYHTAMLDIWRPFLDDKSPPVSSDYKPRSSSPRNAYDASVRQLKRLVYLYRKRFETTNLTMLITPGYLYLLNEVFQSGDSPDAQFSFILSVRGCLSIARWCRGLSGISKAFISYGRRIGIFQRPGWDTGMIEDIRAATMALVPDGGYSSLYPISLDPAGNTIEADNMEALANEFQQLAMQEVLHHKSETPEAWKGDPRDLNLTLSEATEARVDTSPTPSSPP
ncbi:Conidial development fluffy [Fusarium albosuccineum]|uniref:Conidial development fluffy n=1 Tax=Fusarium albosuccineum TaxID=1237068 RepID=A0A8H4L822_9HYPO|nr:Conidial development fluffy [Fusarium albosuccineum]